MRGPTGAFPGGTDGAARVHGVLRADPGSCTVPGDHTLSRDEWQLQQTTPQPEEVPEMGRRRLAEEVRRGSGYNPPRATSRPTPRPLTHTVGDAVTQSDVDAAVAAAYDEYNSRSDEAQTQGRRPAEGRFIAVQEGKPYKGTTFHLFTDCGHLTSSVSRPHAPSEPPWHVRDLSDEVIELLCLKVCSTCDRRTKLLTLDDVLDQFFQGHMVVRDPNTIKRFRRALIHHLDDWGFVIRQIHKNQPHLRSDEAEDDHDHHAALEGRD